MWKRIRNALLTLLDPDHDARFRSLESQSRALIADLEIAHDKVNTLLARLAQRDRRAERAAAPEVPAEPVVDRIHNRAAWKASILARNRMMPRIEETG